MSGLAWAVPGAGGADGLVRLRRDGRAPLRFVGALIARSPTSPTTVGLTYDLAVYHDADGGFAAHIVALLTNERGAIPSRCHAAHFETLDPVLSWLESHDATQDICPAIAVRGLDLGHQNGSALTWLIDAARLQVAGRDTVRRYRTAVGQLLMAVAQAALS